MEVVGLERLPWRRWRGGLCLAALALLAAPGVQAKSYVCGRVIQDKPCPPPPAKVVVVPRPCEMQDAEWDRAATRDRAFLSRHPNPASHRVAHRAELEPVVARLGPMVERLGLLTRDRLQLDKEIEFYRGKPLPAALAAADDANRALLAGLALAFQRLEESIRKIDADQRCQVETFGPLWSGAATGISACRRPACTPP